MCSVYCDCPGMPARLRAAVLAVVVSIFSAAASAQREPAEKWYAGAGAGYSSIEVCDIWGCLYSDTVDPDIGVTLTVGRQLTDRFAFEFGYFDFGAPKWGDIGLRYRVDVDGFHAGVAWKFPFLKRWHGYLKGGMIDTNGTSRVDVWDFSAGRYVDSYQLAADDVELMLGGGAELPLSEVWRVRFGLHLQEIDDRLLDAREGSLQGAFVELHRIF